MMPSNKHRDGPTTAIESDTSDIPQFYNFNLAVYSQLFELLG